jgi:L-2,4-diaminobutyrate decarboxylase
MSRYQELLATLRQSFPTPVSNPVHDGYVVFSLLKALDRVDALKSQAPILGTPRQPDYTGAAKAQLSAAGRSLEEVIPELVHCLDGQLIFGHPRSQVNVVAYPSIASIIGVVLPSMYNPNLCSDETNLGFSEAEVRVAAMTAALIGYDPQQAGGLFTFGGTGTLLYGIKIGLEKALPETFEQGLRSQAVILCSQQSHYACATAAGWLGLGQQCVRRVNSLPNNSIDLRELEAAIREVHARNEKIAAIVATMGTTDAFGVDDLAGIYSLRDQLVLELQLDYRPHIHADAVIGWAWSVFNDYDFAQNALGFRGRTLRALAATQHAMQHLKLADSVGIDFHKTGFAPYISSLFLLRDRSDFGRIVRQRETTPYLFHTGEYHPGLYSLETSRAATGVMAALANLLLLGREGFQTLIGHAVEMAELLREQIGARPELSVMNHQNYGPVTLFRAYPPGTDTFVVKQREQHDASFREELKANNEFNRRIYDRVHAEAMAGRGVALGYTGQCRLADCGEPISALKSYVLSPYADEGWMASVIANVLEARQHVLAGS